MATESHPQDADPPDSINEFVVAGEFGFARIEGPISVEKEGTKWTVRIPEDHDEPTSGVVHMLPHHEGEAAILIADCEAVGGGIVELVDQPEGHDEFHVVVDQYARGDPHE